MRWIAVAFVLALVTAHETAHACGAAFPGGPVMCDNPRAELWRRGPPIARLSASYAYTSTTLLFGDGRRADLTRHTVFGGIEIPFASRLSLQIAAGGIAGGDLVHDASRSTIGPGFTGAAGVAWRVLTQEDARPFVQLSATLSGTHMLTRTETNGTTQTPRFTAFDLRLAAVAGWTFFESFTPYALARVFGGPAYWHYDGDAVTGTDLHKYQFGAGAALALFKNRLDVFAEGVPLGELGFVAGAGTTFF
ncbi:MAG TPA: hypothetical protein VIF62_38230 [Labilithrix sp.]|jgi:hypothetical protein